MDNSKEALLRDLNDKKLTVENAFTKTVENTPNELLEEMLTDICNEIVCLNIDEDSIQLFLGLAESYLASRSRVSPQEMRSNQNVANWNKANSQKVPKNNHIQALSNSNKASHTKASIPSVSNTVIPGLSIPKTVGQTTTIVWFRRDCRLDDNPALYTACESSSSVIPVFIWNPKEEGPLADGGATKFWLSKCLESLKTSLREEYSSNLILRKSDNTLKELVSLVKETNAKKIFFTALYEPILKKRDDNVASHMKKLGVEVAVCHSYLLYRPDKVQTEGIGLRGIGSVTHFLEACRLNSPGPIGEPLPKPGIAPKPAFWPSSLNLKDLMLYVPPRRRDGTVVDWAAGMRQNWIFGEKGANANLSRFLSEGIRNYEKESCRADQANTAVISPYLHFGEISPRRVLMAAFSADLARSPKFQRKLAWRDLSYWLLHLFPTLDSEPVRPPYKHQRWSQNRVSLRAWQKGETGFPLVDAAMRQLWQIGWMSNYMRHVVASFLISYLHISWIEGYKWFQDTLVDADVAINAMMWQNGGFSGFDQWNFVMHPVDAALTCDPKGDYVRKWIPQLKDLPDEYIHQPWKCPPSVLRRCGITLGVTYPNRIIVDLHEAREQSLRDVSLIRRRFGRSYIDKHTGNDIIPIPASLLLPCLGTNSEEDFLDSETGLIMIPVITRKEFKYRTSNPEAKDNPYNAVLKGYVSRKRDEAIAWANRNDFTASTINEAVLRAERGGEPNSRGRGTRRTHNRDPFSSV